MLALLQRAMGCPGIPNSPGRKAGEEAKSSVCVVGKNAGVLQEGVQAGDGMDLLREIAPPVGSGWLSRVEKVAALDGNQPRSVHRTVG